MSRVATAIAHSERALARSLDAQVNSGADRGLVIAGDTGIPYLPTGLLCHGLPLYGLEASRYYLDGDLAQRLRTAGNALLRLQAADGTVSMIDCNFHSPPDAAFVINALAPALWWAQQTQVAWPPDVLQSIESFFDRARPAMLTGGIHTPNHRWVMVCALAWLERLHGGPEFRLRAEEWLAEGWDITEDGEWTERSNAVYNVVCADSLITASLLFERPSLREPVRRNLRMMQYLVHPSGEIVTDYSHRQDANQVYSVSRYYRAYRFLAALDNDSQFAAMADWAAEQGGACSLVDELLYPELTADEVPRDELPKNYTVYFGNSEPFPEEPRIFHYQKPQRRYVTGAGIARVRRGDLSVTLIAEHPDFLALRAGDVRLLGMRIVPAFFGCGPFRFPILAQHSSRDADGATFTMGRDWTAWYNGPLPPGERVPTGEWPHMDHAKRPHDHHTKLSIRCKVHVTSGGIELEVAASGQARCPVQMGFRFDAAGHFEPESEVELLGEGDALLCGERARFRQGNDTFEIEGHGTGHRIQTIRGDEARPHTRNLLINEMAPFERRFILRYREAAPKV